jgi:hypothetical protein
MEKKIKFTYWVSTCLFSLVIIGSIVLYITQYDRFSTGFLKLGYPSYLIYPLIVAKSLGLIAIWSRKVNWLKEWAYAGFFFNLALSLVAHFAINTGNHLNALIAMIFLLISYTSQKYVFQQEDN